jgi:hypothetical protein
LPSGFFKPSFPDYLGKYSEEESKSSASGIAGDLGDDPQETRAPTIAQLLQEKTLYSFSEWPKVSPRACILHLNILSFDSFISKLLKYFYKTNSNVPCLY